MPAAGAASPTTRQGGRGAVSQGSTLTSSDAPYRAMTDYKRKLDEIRATLGGSLLRRCAKSLTSALKSRLKCGLSPMCDADRYAAHHAIVRPLLRLQQRQCIAPGSSALRACQRGRRGKGGFDERSARHRDAQPALGRQPLPQVWRAICEPEVRSGHPPRVLVPIWVSNPRTVLHFPLSAPPRRPNAHAGIGS